MRCYGFLLLSISEKFLMSFNRKLFSITFLVQCLKGFCWYMFWNSCDKEMSDPQTVLRGPATEANPFCSSVVNIRTSAFPENTGFFFLKTLFSGKHQILKTLFSGYSCASSQATEEQENRCRADFLIIFCVYVCIYICKHMYILTQFTYVLN